VINIFTGEHGLSSEPAKISLLLYRISQGVNKLIRDKGKEHDISSTQIESIIFLSGAHPDNKNVTSIARRLQVAQPTATRVVNSLVERGLVERERCEADRRKIKLSLTDRGREITRDINEISQTLIEAVGELSDGRQKELNQDLVKIAGRLQSQGHISIALTCQYCRYFERNGGSTDERPHLCRLTGQDLGEDESHSEWVHKESGLDLFN
jgi:DNA-binding MarR family transcriptional regulator